MKKKPPLTDEEKLELIRDKMRGGPMRRLMEFAEQIDVSYDDLIYSARAYLETGEYWNEGDKFESTDMPITFWSDYELVTGEVVPADKRDHFFSCSC